MWCGIVSSVSSIPTADDVLDPQIDVLAIEEVATAFGVPVSRVHQSARDGHLIVMRRAGRMYLPADLIDGTEPVKGLTGTITLLRDAGYTPTEMLRWLFEADESLPGTPIHALRSNRGREVKRRAQALGF
jgi:hypothetical protein